MNTKSSLRGYFLELLTKQGSQERKHKSSRIAQQLYKLPAFVNAQTVLFYASLPGEVETFAMMTMAMQLHKHVALPVITRDQRKIIPTLTDSVEGLPVGLYGIPSPHPDRTGGPVDLQALDMVVVPGLAFDKAKNRLGRGKGYYDRFLRTLPERTAKVGIAFDFQIVDCLPVEEHDVPLDVIIAA